MEPREWKDAAKGTGMSFATRNKIIKPLHPDTRKHMSGAEHLAGTELEAALDSLVQGVHRMGR